MPIVLCSGYVGLKTGNRRKKNSVIHSLLLAPVNNDSFSKFLEDMELQSSRPV